MRRPFRIEVRHDAAQPGTTVVERRDTGYLRSPETTPQGFLLAEGVAAIAGVYEYVYRDGDGKRRVVRELVDADVLRAYADQLGRTPLTLEHPRENGKPISVTRQNATRYVVGDVDGEVDFVETKKGGFVRVRMCVRADEALQAIDGGVDQLSCGYSARVDPTPGTHPIFGAYDQRQVERFNGNHLAIVAAGRHGNGASFRADDADALPADLPAGVGIQLSPPSPEAARVDDEDGSPSTPPHEDSMNPNLIALAAILGVKRADGMSDDAFTKAILSEAQKKADAAETAEANRVDAEEKAAADAGLKAVTDMMKSRLKDVEGFSEDMSPKAMADMMGKAYDKAIGERDAAKAKSDALEAAETKRADDAARADLKALVKAKKLQVEIADDADLPAVRKTIAEALLGGADKLRSDSADYIAAVIDLHRGDDAGRGSGNGGGNRDPRLDGLRGDGDGSRSDDKGGGGNGERRDSRFYDPTVDNHDSAFAAAQ